MIDSDNVAGRWDSSYHAPVMVEEVVRLFEGAKGILDCTLGGGGHTEALLVAGASVVAIDRDEAAITEARKRLASYETSGRFRALRGNFGEIAIGGNIQSGKMVIAVGLQGDDAGVSLLEFQFQSRRLCIPKYFLGLPL